MNRKAARLKLDGHRPTKLPRRPHGPRTGDPLRSKLSPEQTARLEEIRRTKQALGES
jgi:hypothetical protein